MKASLNYRIIYDALWILHVELQADILRANMSTLLLLSINYADRFLKKKNNVKWVSNIIIGKENVTLNEFMLKVQSVVVSVYMFACMYVSIWFWLTSYLILEKHDFIMKKYSNIVLHLVRSPLAYHGHLI